MTVFRVVAFDKLVEIAAFQRIGFKGKFFISPEIIDYEFSYDLELNYNARIKIILITSLLLYPILWNP